MLHEDEFAIVDELYGAGMKATKEFRQQQGLHLEGLTIDDRFQPVLDAYERITSFRETNANAVMHHRLALYGPPCANCGKPLRTPRASRCMECGVAKINESS